MDLWVTYLTLQGKTIDLNHLKSDIMYDMIEGSLLNFEYTIYGKG